MPVINLAETFQKVEVGHAIGETILFMKAGKMEVQKRDRITVNDVVTDKGVTMEQKQQLVDILHENRECIALNLDEFGRTNKIEMKIELKENSQPVQSKPYRLNAKYRIALEDIIKEYKQKGIITENESEFTSLAFIIRKKDGSPRMVMDYRKLNANTKPVNFRIPNFYDMLANLNGAKYFITLKELSNRGKTKLKQLKNF